MAGCLTAAEVAADYIVVVAPPGGETPDQRPAFVSSLDTNAKVAQALRSAADAIEALDAKDAQDEAETKSA